MFAAVWPTLEPDAAPIGSVTNGVHAPTWMSLEMSTLLERHRGAGATSDAWEVLPSVSDDELWRFRETNRAALVGFARRYVRDRLIARGMREHEITWCDELLDPAALTIGFARRFAPYKRATLVLRDRDRLRKLLTSSDRPVQMLFAGKAHPADATGKELVHLVAELALDPELRGRLVFLDDYDIGVARMLVRGADLWLNTPRRPLEACGTSGMKVVVNGGLNCSVLDGWWDECYADDLGWAIPSAESVTDEDARDAIEGDGLLELLEGEVLDAFWTRTDGLPRAWLARVRASLMRLGPRVDATRMVREYVEQWYLPAGLEASVRTG
jgi:starch phosphorylase